MTTPITSITSLLNALHSHLQSQTQLLPTLHNQLGLPQTALADDLTALQKQLAECVESQIDYRRKQVDEWMGRCDSVERECLRYSKALGSHAKATGSSLGEIRKEQVLPRRFDKISEHQERLRQVCSALCCLHFHLVRNQRPLTAIASSPVIPHEARAAEYPHKPSACTFPNTWSRFLSAGHLRPSEQRRPGWRPQHRTLSRRDPRTLL